MNTEDEKKLFEEKNIIITNRRVVIDNEQIQLDDIKYSLDTDDSIRDKGTFAFAGMGILAFLSGEWLFGLIMILCAYGFRKIIRTKDRLMISMNDGGIKEFLFKNDSDFVFKVSKKIREAAGAKRAYEKMLKDDNLKKELDNLS